VMDWSPDERFLLLRIGRPDGTAALSVLSLDGSETRTLKTVPWWESYQGAGFSPDGRWAALAFHSSDPGAGSRDGNLFVVATDGSEGRALVEGEPSPRLLGWSSEGFVLFSSHRGGTPGIWRLRMDDGRPLGSPERVKPDLWGIAPLGFDREGRFYYVHRIRAPELHEAVLDPERREMTRSFRPVDPQALGETGRPTWSPDGRHLAYLVEGPPFLGGSGAHRTIRIRDLEAGEVRELDVPFGGLLGVRWTPDGRRLLAVAGRTLFRVDVQTGRVERLFHHQGIRASLLPDGRGVLYQRTPSGDDPASSPGSEAREDGMSRVAVELLVRDLETGNETELHRHETLALNPYQVIPWAAVSPDGQRVAFVRLLQEDVEGADRERFHDLVILPLVGGEPEVVLSDLELPLNVWDMSLAWDWDGASIVFAGPGRGDVPSDLGVTLWRALLDRGEIEKVTGLPEGTRTDGVALHPDGRRVAFVKGAGPAEAEVWVLENIAPVEARATTGSGRDGGP